MRRFSDIRFSTDFLTDYDSAPKEIQDKLDQKIHIWALTGSFTPSAQAHKAYQHDGLWIIYLKLGSGGYRLLVRFDGDCLVLERLMDHEDVLKYLNINS